MDRIEALFKELTAQVARLAFAVEKSIGEKGAQMYDPCKCCGCTLKLNNLPLTTCPACRTENAR